VSRHIVDFSPQRSAASFRSWLKTTVRTRAIDHLRKKARQVDAAGGTAAQMQIADLPDPVAATSPQAFAFLETRGLAPSPDQEHDGKVKSGTPPEIPGAVAFAVVASGTRILIEKTNWFRDNAIRAENARLEK